MTSLRALLVLALALGACGLKSDPRGADQVRPKPITTLTGEPAADGVRLNWQRTSEYVNGQRMDDLGGFKVFRGTPGELSEEIAEIAVTDRDRFRPEKQYEYLDKRVSPGATYYYRIVSFTTDEYYSAPSNQVKVTSQP
ncbi:MAG: hypothetical protein ACREQ9_08610 [Candidatus Binatia bacterium]